MKYRRKMRQHVGGLRRAMRLMIFTLLLLIHIQLLSAQGTEQPSAQPTGHPSSQPTGQPTSQPIGRPTSQPTGQPSAQPTGQPSVKPSSQPVPSSSAAPTTSGAIISTRKPSPGLLSTASRVAVDPVSEGPPPVSYPLDFGEHVLSAIVLVLCAGISSHLCFGYSSKQSRETFIGLILLIMLGFQLFHLLRAALYVPASRYYVYNKDFHRTDCLNSLKGGKKSFQSILTIDENPCFCVPPSTCTVSGVKVNLSAGGSCPLDALCRGGPNNDTEISPYLSDFRNCIGGQGPSCTRDQPCFPCKRETLKEWSGTGKSFAIARCRTCSSEFNGNCNFIPDVGPYCYVKPGSKQVTPCTRCCTEPAPLILNGTCY